MCVCMYYRKVLHKNHCTLDSKVLILSRRDRNPAGECGSSGERHLPNTRVVDHKREHSAASAVLPFYGQIKSGAGRRKGEADERQKTNRLQRHVQDAGSAHGGGAPADEAVL